MSRPTATASILLVATFAAFFGQARGVVECPRDAAASVLERAADQVIPGAMEHFLQCIAEPYIRRHMAQGRPDMERVVSEYGEKIGRGEMMKTTQDNDDNLKEDGGIMTWEELEYLMELPEDPSSTSSCSSSSTSLQSSDQDPEELLRGKLENVASHWALAGMIRLLGDISVPGRLNKKSMIKRMLRDQEPQMRPQLEDAIKKNALVITNDNTNTWSCDLKDIKGYCKHLLENEDGKRSRTPQGKALTKYACYLIQ